MSKKHDPLRSLKVASPCPANWETMYGDDRVRFCGQCELNVYNLSGMTRTDAERLLASREGRLCVRYYKRADGTVLTQDCPVGLAAVRRRVARVAGAVAGFVLGVFSGLGATVAVRESGFADPAPGAYEQTMGTIAIEPPQPVERVVMGAIAMPPPAPHDGEFVTGEAAPQPRPASHPKAAPRAAAR